MKKLLFVLTLFGLVINVFAQENDGPNFNIESFNEHCETAEWLFEYDMIAWWTSDSVMTESEEEIKRLGKEWFCFKDSVWHAVYGNYKDNSFDLVFHYIVDENNNVSRIYEEADSSLLHRYSRALITASSQLEGLKDSVHIRFNQYVKENDDNTLTVYIFPAFQPNSVAIYGGEFVYKIDETGTKILEDHSYYSGKLLGFKVGKPREIWLDYSEIEEPTLGGVFFVWYYKAYFTKIVLETKTSTSSLFQHKDKSYYWVHAIKEE